MKYFERTVTVKDYQGAHGKAVYVNQRQFFKTNSEKVIAQNQKGLKIKFYETKDKDLIKALRKMEGDKIHTETEQLTNSQIYWRKNISRRWH